MMDTPPTTTPKRKRGVETTITPILFKFDLSNTGTSEDGGDSPRSKVVHRFRGLALGAEGDGYHGGGGVAPGDAGQGDDDDSHYEDSPLTKRVRGDTIMNDADFSDKAAVEETTKASELPLPEVLADEPPSHEPHRLSLPDGDGSLQRAYPSINRLSDSVCRASKKRAGSPPPPALEGKESIAESDQDADDEVEEVEIVEPIRAALTWREDEITIYDPDDADDDGTGINGVGFKPSPALAQARVNKRRQQLAEYRKREESEARAKRSQRRRAGAAARRSTPSPEQQAQAARRKVRFMDSGEKTSAIAMKS